MTAGSVPPRSTRSAVIGDERAVGWSITSESPSGPTSSNRRDAPTAPSNGVIHAVAGLPSAAATPRCAVPPVTRSDAIGSRRVRGRYEQCCEVGVAGAPVQAQGCADLHGASVGSSNRRSSRRSGSERHGSVGSTRKRVKTMPRGGRRRRGDRRSRRWAVGSIRSSAPSPRSISENPTPASAAASGASPGTTPMISTSIVLAVLACGIRTAWPPSRDDWSRVTSSGGSSSTVTRTALIDRPPRGKVLGGAHRSDSIVESDAVMVRRMRSPTGSP